MTTTSRREQSRISPSLPILSPFVPGLDLGLNGLAITAMKCFGLVQSTAMLPPNLPECASASDRRSGAIAHLRSRGCWPTGGHKAAGVWPKAPVPAWHRQHPTSSICARQAQQTRACLHKSSKNFWCQTLYLSFTSGRFRPEFSFWQYS